MAERVFVWAGGAVFVASLSFCAISYALRWSVADGNGWPAAAFDALLISVFALHHSVFARDPLKQWLGRAVPERLIRSVYVWTASLLFLAACAAWRPIGGEWFDLHGPWRWLGAAVQLLGLWLSVQAVRGLDPLELAGIRQLSARHTAPVDSRQPADDSQVGRRTAPDEGHLMTGGPYRLVRHPLYLGWILLVFGAAHMTGDRLAFAALTSAYLVIAIPWEERSLVRAMGDDYRRYRHRVRWRVVPFIY